MLTKSRGSRRGGYGEHLAAWIAETPAEGKAAVAPKGWFAKQYADAKGKKG